MILSPSEIVATMDEQAGPRKGATTTDVDSVA
jgi:hypothetical protein